MDSFGNKGIWGKPCPIWHVVKCVWTKIVSLSVFEPKLPPLGVFKFWSPKTEFWFWVDCEIIEITKAKSSGKDGTIKGVVCELIKK